MVLQEPVSGSAMSNNEHTFADRNRHLVEVPDSFAIARWPRDADVATIARCMLATLKYEPHATDTAVLRRALEGVIEHTTQHFAEARGDQDYDGREEDSGPIRDAAVTAGRAG
jgi:hypothetical protein